MHLKLSVAVGESTTQEVSEGTPKGPTSPCQSRYTLSCGCGQGHVAVGRPLKRLWLLGKVVPEQVHL